MNKVDADYIGLLVLDVFNAAIGRQNIRSEYTFRNAVRPLRRCLRQRTWQSSRNAHLLLATECSFACTLVTCWMH